MTVQQTTFLIRIGGLTCICMSLGIFSFILFANDKQYQSHQNWSQTHNLSQMLTLTCVTFIRDNSTGSRDRESQGWIKRWLTFGKRHSRQQWFFRPARRFQIFKTILAILSELWLSFSWLFIGNICWITFLPHRVLEITPFLLDTQLHPVCPARGLLEVKVDGEVLYHLLELLQRGGIAHHHVSWSLEPEAEVTRIQVWWI